MLKTFNKVLNSDFKVDILDKFQLLKSLVHINLRTHGNVRPFGFNLVEILGMFWREPDHMLLFLASPRIQRPNKFERVLII